MIQEEQAWYVYCVLRPKVGTAASLPVEGLLPGCAVELLASDALLLAVSRVPAALFSSPLLEEQLRDADWVRERALAHQRVLDALLQGYTVAPLSFCTVYQSRERLELALAPSQATMLATLERLAGADEWGVKAYASRQVLVGWAAAHAAELEPQRQKIAVATPGAAFFLRKKLAAAAEQLVASLLAATSGAIYEQLSSYSRAVATVPLQAQAAHGRADEMVLNLALLVDEAAEPALRAALEELAASYRPHGLVFELTGPWPPYHFTS